VRARWRRTGVCYRTDANSPVRSNRVMTDDPLPKNDGTKREYAWALARRWATLARTNPEAVIADSLVVAVVCAIFYLAFAAVAQLA